MAYVAAMAYSPIALDRLVELVSAYFERTGTAVTIDESRMVVSGGAGWVAGLVNLHQELADLPEHHHEDFVGWWFDQLLVARDLELPAEYRQAAQRLRTRLTANLVPAHEGVVSRSVGGGLHEVLMMKIEIGALAVPKEHLAGWGVDPEQVWSDARRHVLLDEPRERLVAIRPNGERFVWVKGSPWVSSLLPELGVYLRPRNRFGALAAIPCDDVLFYHAIGDGPFPESVLGMQQLEIDFYVHGPKSLSPHLYWWRAAPSGGGGEIQRVVRIEEGGSVPEWGRDFSMMLAEFEQEGHRRPPDQKRRRRPSA